MTHSRIIRPPPPPLFHRSYDRKPNFPVFFSRLPAPSVKMGAEQARRVRASLSSLKFISPSDRPLRAYLRAICTERPHRCVARRGGLHVADVPQFSRNFPAPVPIRNYQNLLARARKPSTSLALDARFHPAKNFPDYREVNWASTTPRNSIVAHRASFLLIFFFLFLDFSGH